MFAPSLGGARGPGAHPIGAFFCARCQRSSGRTGLPCPGLVQPSCWLLARTADTHKAPSGKALARFHLEWREEKPFSAPTPPSTREACTPFRGIQSDPTGRRSADHRTETPPHVQHGLRTREAKTKKPLDESRGFFYLGWLMGLEPTTTGITILDSTN